MSDWPRGLDIASIREWPGTLREAGTRKVPPFESTRQTRDRDGRQRWERKSVSLTDTLALLDRELTALHADEIELLIAIAPGQFRLDGRPRADAKPEHPGVVLQFTTDLGRLAYPCDTFTTWQGNLRAITLALEALRKVDRYGVTAHGEQYRGFIALEREASTSSSQAEAWLRGFTSDDGPIRDVIARAKRIAHPDLGGDVETFQRVLDAERTLRGTAA